MGWAGCATASRCAGWPGSWRRTGVSRSSCPRSWPGCATTRTFSTACARPCTCPPGARTTVSFSTSSRPRPGSWALPAADGSPEDTGRAVEFFLSRLHQAMARIKAMREGLFLDGFPSPGPGDVGRASLPNVGVSARGVYFLDHSPVTPADVLNALLESARTGLPLAWRARRLIRENPDRFRARSGGQARHPGHAGQDIPGPARGHGLRRADRHAAAPGPVPRLR